MTARAEVVAFVAATAALHRDRRDCPDCHGEGRVDVPLIGDRPAYAHYALDGMEDCDRCGGYGSIYACAVCGEPVSHTLKCIAGSHGTYDYDCTEGCALCVDHEPGGLAAVTA